MSVPSDERATRLKEALIALVLALASAALSWFSLAGLIPFVRGVSNRAALVSFSPLDAQAMFAALAAFSLAIMLAAPPSGIGKSMARGGTHDPRAARWVGSWLVLSVVFALAALVAGPIARATAAAWAEGNGYSRCPAAQTWEHHPPMRWFRAGGRCP